MLSLLQRLDCPEDLGLVQSSASAQLLEQTNLAVYRLQWPKSYASASLCTLQGYAS